MCDRFRRICNILFCIENDLGAILQCACLLNRMLPSSFPYDRESSRRCAARSLPRALRGSWLAATGEDDLSLYFPGRSSSSNKKVSPFSLSLFSLPSPPTSPLPFYHPILPLSSSIWCGLLFFLPPSLTVFLLNDRPFTAVSDDVAGARRFPRESRDSLALSCSLSLSLSLFSLHLSVSSFLCHWLFLPLLSTPVTLLS